MKDEELEIEEPTGKFILDNLPFEKRFQTANGMYIHYSDVCQLLKKYHESKVKKLNKADVSGRSEQCCSPTDGFYLGTTCPHCNKPFRKDIK